jgi:hypothetical protein
MRGVSEARAAGLDVELSIVSAGHGIVAGSDRLAPYERTFQGMAGSARRELARALAIPATVRRVLGRPADLQVVLLGDDYLEACEFGADFVPSSPVLVFCAAGTALRMPPIRDVTVIPLTTDETRRFRCGFVALKGEVGGRLLVHVVHNRPSIAELTSPSLLQTLTSVAPHEVTAAATLF